MKKGPKFIKYVVNSGDRGKAKSCQICNQSFSALSAKEHQCKRCKRAVCEKCSPYKAFTIIDGVPSKTAHRQCYVCKEESESLKKFIQQYKIVFMEDTYSKEWLKSFGSSVEQANLDFDQSQREESNLRNKEESVKMKSELPQVFQEIVHFKNYSLSEFFYLVIKDFNITLILDSINRVLGTFLKIYPEVGYAPDQVFTTLFLLCFCSEASAYQILVFMYSLIIPHYTYPLSLRKEKCEFFTEIDKTMQVLTQAYKISSQDSPYVKTFLRYRLVRYIQSFTINFFLFETTFFIINQLFLQPQTGYDDLTKYLATAYNGYIQIFRQQSQDEIELILLRNVRSVKIQDGYFLTKQVDFSKVIPAVQKSNSNISARQPSFLQDGDQGTGIKQQDQIIILRTEVERQQKVIQEQQSKIEKQKLEIENLELKLQQTQQVISLYKSPGKDINLDQYISQQDEELQNLRRVTQQQKQNNFDLEKQQLQAYIKKLESQVFIEYKANIQLKEQLEQSQLTKSQASTASQDQYEYEILEKNLQKYKRKYEKLKAKQSSSDQNQQRSKKDEIAIAELEAKLQLKEKQISELELKLNKNKFDTTAKIVELESSIEQLEKQNKLYKKSIQDIEVRQSSLYKQDNGLVQQLQRQITDSQNESNFQLRQVQERFNQQIQQLQQQIQKEQKAKFLAESQLKDLTIKLEIQEKQQKQVTASIQNSNQDISNGAELQKELQRLQAQLKEQEERYQQLKSKHYAHLQMMIQVEKDKLINPEIQLSLINSQEKELTVLQEKLEKKKIKIKQLKQKEKAWMKINQDNVVKINQTTDGKQIGELLTKTIVLLNLDGKVSTNHINDQAISLIVEKISHLIEQQTTFSEEFSNIFEDGQFVQKLNELMDDVEDSFVFDYNSLRALIEKVNSVFSRINSTKQKILQIFKQTFDQNDLNQNPNLDIVILQLQQKLQQFQIDKEELESRIQQLQLSKNKYLEVQEESKREKKILQGVRDIIIDLPIFSPSEVFSFSEQRFKNKQVDQEDAKLILEVRNQQITTLKLILTEKQTQLETLNNGMIKLKDLMSNYFVQIMK
ncbi:unnamed protein product [Paramecium octaurelia]|uniref:FYVE-type domain-containing protein n=1 Tax=Paramecium octaurelia TaxID=43137 RepID=A0A8S1SH71_PAROT|nr:unnamed protein product [Paramecium octaurelia]